MRSSFDPDFKDYGRNRTTDAELMVMKQTMNLLRRYGVTQTDVARTSGVHKVHLTRMFEPPLRVDGEPKRISRAYAQKICRGLAIHCRRVGIDPNIIEDVMRTPI